MTIKNLVIILTTKCNFSCDYCYINRKNENMDKKVIRKLIYSLPLFLSDNKNSYLSIQFFGGEPLLEWKLIEQIVGNVRKIYPSYKINFHISTNGYLLNEKNIIFCRDNGINIRLSLDGQPATHDRHRKLISGEKTFGIIKRHFHLLTKYTGRNFIRVTLHPSEVRFLFDNIKWIFEKLKATDICVGPAYVGVRWTIEEVACLREEWKKIGVYYLNSLLRGKLISIDNFGFLDSFLLGKAQRYCYKSALDCQCSRSLCIDPKGNIWPCDIFSYGILSDKFSLGNIMHLDPKKIINKLRSNKALIHKACMRYHYPIREINNIWELHNLIGNINLYLFRLIKDSPKKEIIKQALIYRNEKYFFSSAH